MRRTVVLAAMVAGCTALPPAPKPVGPFITLAPPKSAALHRPSVPHTGDSPAAVVRDTDALQEQATQYVVRRDSKPAVIDRLATLTFQTRAAAARARASRRAADVTAARVAADGLAAFLATQATGK